MSDPASPTATAPARRPRRWIPYAAGALAFLVTLVLVGTLVSDWAARNYEMRTLLTRIEASETAMGDLQANVEEILARYQAEGELTDESRAALDAELAAVAATGRDSIAAAGDGVAGVRWLAWHRDVSRAQEAYLAHNRAWQAYLDRAAKDPAEFSSPQDAVNKTFEDAQAPIRAALPVPALFDLLNRVDVVFAPPPPATNGPTQQV